MSQVDDAYKHLVCTIINRGTDTDSRAGKVRSHFGHQLIVDLKYGFPLLTTKKLNFLNIVHELNWFLRGETNIKTLKAPQLWEPWADPLGECGRIYGYQWRTWEYGGLDAHGEFRKQIDQISVLLKGLKENPSSRRHIVSAWKVEDLDSMALPPCHCFFQCHVRGTFLDLHLYQRSADTAIGVPYNIASYALLLMMLARETGLEPGRFIHTFGDVHIYDNHREKLIEQVYRQPCKAPTLILKEGKSFWDLVYEDDPLNYSLENYTHGKFIKYEVSV